MKFDASDLAKLAGQITAALTGGYATLGGRSGQAAGAGTNASGTTAAQAASKQQNIFQEILKALSVFDGLKSAWNIIVRNSTVANTYLGAMGKLFGAAIDMLLIPFIPVLNLIMIGLAKLVEWLSRDDVQKKLKEIADYTVKILEKVGDYLYKSFLQFIADAKDFYNDAKPTLKSILDVANKIIEVANNILNKLGLGGGGKLLNDAPWVAGIALVLNKLLGGLPGKAGAKVAGPIASKVGGGLASLFGSLAIPATILAGTVLAGSGLAENILPSGKIRDYAGAPNRAIFGNQADQSNTPVNDFDKLPGWAKSALAKKFNTDTNTLDQAMTASVNITVNGQQDPAKFSQMVKEEVEKITRKANR